MFSPVSLLYIKYDILFDVPLFIIFINKIAKGISFEMEYVCLKF